MATNSTPGNNRQTNLFGIEDWKKLYSSFSEADFQAYDFPTIRKVLVDYLRTYYAENFNDFIESSEYIALLDLIAFQAQSLAFRTDLNARENFLDTAERKDSVLRLVKQLSYTPNRNKAANGLLKIQSITTTESVFDYSSANLASANIVWNDPSNPNWATQFSLVLNAALSSGQRIGKPFARQTINSIITEQYNLAVPDSVQAIFPFSATINSYTTPFEVVSANITSASAITEDEPGNAFGNFGMVFQNDGRGNASNNTGYFLFFKQGTTNSLDLAFTSKIPNSLVEINIPNINNEDVWLYELDNGILGAEWSQVENVAGSNAIYNSTARGIRTLYQVNTMADDAIALVFGDDTFSDIPMGNFRSFFRVSNGLTYRISPADLYGITVIIPYVGKDGSTQRLTITASLQYTVSNSSRRDLVSEIKNKAPQNFYTQGRMVNGEDYNVVPYAAYSDIVKVKSVNRFSSGVSRYLDVVDPTGKYSSTNMFGADGGFYKDSTENYQTFSFASRNEVVNIIQTKIQPLASAAGTKHFFYDRYPTVALSSIGWVRQTDDTVTSSGFFKQTAGTTYEKIGSFASTNLRYLLPNSLIQFVSPPGYYFDSTNSLVQGSVSSISDKTVIWATIKTQIGDGTTAIYLAGRTMGAVTISETIPTGAIVTSVYPPFTTKFTSNLINIMTNYMLNNVEFSLRYDYTLSVSAEPWVVVPISSTDQISSFDITTAGTNSDSSWLMLFKTDGMTYSVTYRGLDYVFSSSESIRFIDSNPTTVYDAAKNTLVNDNIKVLRSNTTVYGTTPLTRDVQLKIYKNAVENDGYTDSTKVLVTYPTGPNSDLPLDPNIFSAVVGDANNTYICYEQFVDYDNLIRYRLLESGVVSTVFATRNQILAAINNYPADRLFYASSDQKFYKVKRLNNVNSLDDVTEYYRAYVGRQDLLFQYTHNASDSRRIDPAASNLIDCYILTRSYDEAYRNYATDYTGTLAEPLKVNSVNLNSSYTKLMNIKMISDELILNSGVYKPLFGVKADPSLRGKFQIVKSPYSTISDNELISRVIEHINNYFALENWDFGNTFFFSELSGYIHSKLGIDLSSMILIPTSPNSKFGDLYEIRSQPNEILISAATVEDVQVVSGVHIGINQSGTTTVSAKLINSGA